MMKKSDIMNLMKKIHSGTPGTGMKDDVPATINGADPAALSEGEYVFDAQTVALIGDGNSAAGARILDEVRIAIRKLKGKSLKDGVQPGPLTELIKDAKKNSKKRS